MLNLNHFLRCRFLHLNLNHS